MIQKQNNHQTPVSDKGPLVTVLMSVYNGEEHLSEAIESVLDQTYKYFEFIIIDDGSTDRTLEVINGFKDKRIRTIRNKKNIGLTKSLNIGIKCSRGKYIARMDADDISLPRRLEKQVLFMKKNPEICVCGTFWKIILRDKSFEFKPPTAHEAIKAGLFFGNLIVHSSAMLNADIIRSKNLFYDENYTTSQDYELWNRISQNYKLANISEFLLHLRIDGADRISTITNREQLINDFCVVKNNVEKLLKRSMMEGEIDIHKTLLGRHNVGKNIKHQELTNWTKLLDKANIGREKYDIISFRQQLALQWAWSIRKLQKIQISIFIDFYRLPFRKHLPFGIKGLVKMYLSATDNESQD